MVHGPFGKLRMTLFLTVGSLMFFKSFLKAPGIGMNFIKGSSNDLQLNSKDSSVQGWSFPGQGNFKLNVDASISGAGRIGYGMVVRDHHGHVLMFASSIFMGSNDPAQAEISIIRYALSLAIDAGFKSLKVESDAKTTIDALRGGAPFSPYHANIFADVLYIKFCFRFCCFQTTNELAHHLTCEAFLRDRREIIWMEDLPIQLRAIASNGVLRAFVHI
ncbi:hypothetical protein GH714_011620 [Hevea brasiliensis]|uniref:RNase H type-1 domain-containing protein n=1 Tax=Hevea brasiliensis TaxID=3981 RepID=A0A6A6MTC8_HEVBR|nr:hypothetical protein GH714_011620 [Hevea brasiliensis]